MVDFKMTPMTKEQADQVRLWRIGMGYSWRKIASVAAEKWPEMKIDTHPDGSGFQIPGMDLCSEAAEFFGENAGDEPWN